jgi:hypothetical protein
MDIGERPRCAKRPRMDKAMSDESDMDVDGQESDGQD